eukprot:TRINITY_DN21658_c0_g1_i1.p3 TRINITY_DN21658_c0_g1~~TRINITY_DN21658_c0_g1_i1.p3  ORF type:complete len:114 (-),score=5.21 TRINITY_DN21658_c0_g1_i1:371-712(-)
MPEFRCSFLEVRIYVYSGQPEYISESGFGKEMQVMPVMVGQNKIKFFFMQIIQQAAQWRIQVMGSTDDKNFRAFQFVHAQRDVATGSVHFYNQQIRFPITRKLLDDNRDVVSS